MAAESMHGFIKRGMHAGTFSHNGKRSGEKSQVGLGYISTEASAAVVPSASVWLWLAGWGRASL